MQIKEPRGNRLWRNGQAEKFLQSDLDRAVDYRKEYYKYVIAIATALLAFTVSFPPQLSRAPEVTWLLFTGWLGLGLAVLAGVRVHMTWAKFFVSFRDYDNRDKREEGVKVRGRLTRERRLMDVAQMIGLVVGVIGVVAFTGVNLKYLAPKMDAKATIERAPDPSATKAMEDRSSIATPVAPALVPSSKTAQ